MLDCVNKEITVVMEKYKKEKRVKAVLQIWERVKMEENCVETENQILVKLVKRVLQMCEDVRVDHTVEIKLLMQEKPVLLVHKMPERVQHVSCVETVLLTKERIVKAVPKTLASVQKISVAIKK